MPHALQYTFGVILQQAQAAPNDMMKMAFSLGMQLAGMSRAAGAGATNQNPAAAAAVASMNPLALMQQLQQAGKLGWRQQPSRLSSQRIQQWRLLKLSLVSSSSVPFGC